MRYIDEFRDPRAARRLREDIATLATELAHPVAVMEVCGTHTMSIARYGIRPILPETVRLVSGPGCPVCVTPAGYIDAAIELAARGCLIATFGDMLHVPGSTSSLQECRAAGGRIEVCYSPLDAVTLARQDPAVEVVFLAIGFETTIAPVVSIVDRAVRHGLTNVSLLTAFKLVPPALQALVTDPAIAVDAFLCPAHVSAIIGTAPYQPFAETHRRPCVIAGFEPLDILLGLKHIVAQLAAGRAEVENEYRRVVRPQGNPQARARMAKYLAPVDAEWRGLGHLPASGLGLRPRYAAFDAALKHGVPVTTGRDHPGCRCGDVVKGKIPPEQCPLFGSRCTPDTPVGPCMVSAEGTCAAQFKYVPLAPRGTEAPHAP